MQQQTEMTVRSIQPEWNGHPSNCMLASGVWNVGSVMLYLTVSSADGDYDSHAFKRRLDERSAARQSN